MRSMNFIQFHISLSDKILSTHEFEEDSQQLVVAGRGLKMCQKLKKI